MSNQNTKDAQRVMAYKLNAELRLANRRAKHQGASSKIGGVVTINFAPDAKPMSDFGGVGKVLGPSLISIPEYKRKK
jgi:hypothetical protein